MKWSIQHSDSQTYVKIIWDGLFTVQDFLEMEANLIAQPFWQPGLPLLFDYRQADLSGLCLSDLRILAKKHIADNEIVGKGKMAFLMSSTRDFGLARQYELLAEPTVFSKIMAFRDENDALTWLNSDAEIISFGAELDEREWVQNRKRLI